MKKKLFITFGLGLIIGALYFSGPFVLAAIQSQVGVNTFSLSTNTWNPTLSAQDGGAGVTQLKNLPLFGPTLNSITDGSYSPLTASDNNNAAAARLAGVALYVFDGASGVGNTRVRKPTSDGTINDGIVSSGNMLFNGATFDRSRGSSNAADGLAASTVGNQNTISFPFLFNGTTYDRKKSTSAANLTEVTSIGSSLAVPLSTWSVTNTPAAATQATASKALGGGTVRHVATSITACSAQAAAGQTPIAINLRDGATGAGTVLRTWKIASVLGDSKCVEASGLAMIGTANTAMTIEFAAAGVAGSEQTVTLTGFSVP